MQEMKCPSCGVTMTPEVVQRGRTAGMPKCTSCGKTIKPVAANPEDSGRSPESAPGEQDMTPAPKNMNEPPAIETDLPQSTVMPEQRVIEPSIAAPPTVETDSKPVQPSKPAVIRNRSELENTWYQYCVRVKRVGGYVKGLNAEGQKKADELAKKLGTEVKKGWADKPYIPGFDNSSHVHNQKALFEKPVTMIKAQ